MAAAAAAAAAEVMRSRPYALRPRVLGSLTTVDSETSSAVVAAAFVKKTVSSHPIVIFSKSKCPYCLRAKGAFKELNHPTCSGA